MHHPRALVASAFALAALTAAVQPAGAANAATPNPTATITPTRYVDQVFATTDTMNGATYGHAPDLVNGQTDTLVGDIYAPHGDTVTNRPAIVWIHGGGFAAGDRTQTDPMADGYARRGYVTFSIDYRLDPGNPCQAIQHGTDTDPADELRCETDMQAAQHDAQGAVRFLRANAVRLGIDPDRIAVGGFSAGAVTATHVAAHSSDAGTSGHPQHPSNAQATFGASGCDYLTVWGAEPLDANHAPISMIASTGDQAVFYTCTSTTINNFGPPSELTTYDESAHALALYDEHKKATDAQWTAFLVAQLHLP